MSGGRTEIHRDDDYLMTGTHKGATSTTLVNREADFASCSANAGLYIENVTQVTNSLVATSTEEEVTTDDSISWNNGDVYKIYKTSVKGSRISSIWVDRSRGWKTDPANMQYGWRKDDLDLDRDG